MELLGRVEDCLKGTNNTVLGQWAPGCFCCRTHFGMVVRLMSRTDFSVFKER